MSSAAVGRLRSARDLSDDSADTAEEIIPPSSSADTAEEIIPPLEKSHYLRCLSMPKGPLLP